jgi:hypothetical protein
LDDWRIGVLFILAVVEIFLSITVFKLALGPTQTPMKWESKAVFSGVERLMPEGDRFPPFSNKVK